MKKLFVLANLLVLASLVLTACGGGTTPTATQAPAATEAPTMTEAPAATEAPTGTEAPAVTEAPTESGLLATIKERGYLLVSTDSNYEPYSIVDTAGKRPSDTKCPSDVLTTAEMKGFDVDVAAEIGKRLGVETCLVTVDWAIITAGNWADKWDISVGSMTVTTGRQEIFEFTEPYYYVPAGVAATEDAGITSIEDLAGKPICVGESTDYEAWANNDPSAPNSVPESSWLVKPPADMTVIPQSTDQECAQAIQAGRKEFSAYATSTGVIASNIADGVPVVQVGDPIFLEPDAIAIDKAHTEDITSLVAALNDIVKEMHEDGTLTTLSMKWFNEDLTQAPK
jgi:polar amino acid transport system substrate-binding protein